MTTGASIMLTVAEDWGGLTGRLVVNCSGVAFESDGFPSKLDSSFVDSGRI